MTMISRAAIDLPSVDAWPRARMVSPTCKILQLDRSRVLEVLVARHKAQEASIRLHRHHDFGTGIRRQSDDISVDRLNGANALGHGRLPASWAAPMAEAKHAGKKCGPRHDDDRHDNIAIAVRFALSFIRPTSNLPCRKLRKLMIYKVLPLHNKDYKMEKP